MYNVNLRAIFGVGYTTVGATVIQRTMGVNNGCNLDKINMQHQYKLAASYVVYVFIII